MEKNKNRTDLLAAGRKKLQQYRQKKDNKGNNSKPSSKGGKSGRDVTAGTVAEAAVTQQNPDGDLSKHDTSDTVDLSGSSSGLDPAAYDTVSGKPELDAVVGTSNDTSVRQQHEADGDRFQHDAEDATALPESSFRVDEAASDAASSKSGHGTMAGGISEAALTQKPIEGGEKYYQDVTRTLSRSASRVDSVASERAVANDEPSAKSKVGIACLLEAAEFASKRSRTDNTNDGHDVDIRVAQDDISSSLIREDTTSVAAMALEGSGDLPTDFSPALAREHGEEQVTDVGAMQEVGSSSGNQIDDRMVNLQDGDSNPPLDDTRESVGDLMAADSGNTFKEENGSAAKQLGKTDNASLSVSVINNAREVEEVGDHSFFNSPLAESSMVSAIRSVATGQERDGTSFGSNEEKPEVVVSDTEATQKSSGFVEIERSSEVENNGDAKHFAACKQIDLSSILDGSVIKLSQLAEILQVLDEDEFRYLFMSRESSLEKSRNADQMKADDYVVHDAFERLKEHLYVTSLSKDAFYLQLSEHQKWINEISAVNSSLVEVYGKNETFAKEIVQCRSELQDVVSERVELDKQLQLSKAEVEVFASKVNELQSKLEETQGEMSSMLSELVDCRNLVETLQSENENLKESSKVITEEKNNLSQERANFLLENVKMSEELNQHKTSLESLQSLMQAERTKLEQENEGVIGENSKLLVDLAECNNMVEALKVENKNLNELLTSLSEEREKLEEGKVYADNQIGKISEELIDCKDLIVNHQTEIANLKEHITFISEEKSKLEEENKTIFCEYEKQSHDLVEFKVLEAVLQGECCKALNDLKEASTYTKHLTEENKSLCAELELHKFKVKELSYEKNSSQFGEVGSQGVEDNGGMLQERESDWSSRKQRKLDVYDDSFGIVALKRNLVEAGVVMQKLEREIESMHLDSSSLIRSKDAEAVSQLIQASESKGKTEINDQNLEKSSSSEGQITEDSYMRTKMVAHNLKILLKELLSDAEDASEFCRVTESKVLVNAAGTDRKKFDTLKEHDDQVQEANIELMVLYEAMREFIHHAVAKESELFGLCEAMQQKEAILESENCDLREKMTEFQAQINELQDHLEGHCRDSDGVATSISDQLQSLQEEVADRELVLQEERSSISAQILQAVGMLNSTTHSVSANLLPGDNSIHDVVGSVAASVDGACKVIDGLQNQLESAQCDFQEMSHKTDVAVTILHKLYSELSELVRISFGDDPDAAENAVADDKRLDLLHPNFFSALLDQLRKLSSDRLKLESANKQLSSQLINTAREETDGLQRMYLQSDTVLKLIDEVEQSVKLEGISIYADNPASHLESLIHVLIQKHSEAEKSLRLCGSLEMQLHDLQDQVDHLNFVLVEYGNENLVFKHSLKSAQEVVVALNSRVQEKVAELELSDQRVSSLREKLSIAVTKGKGLISQRDSLKQSLADMSKDLEKCSQELLSKVARLHELETKVKVYSEAGERMEALESELSYIRNSATALRESFLLKDSVLQRLEEILEDLELPEHFHSRDIIEKIDWLAKLVGNHSLPLGEWGHRSSGGEGSYSDAGFVGVDGLKEDMQPNPTSSDDLRRSYEELQNRFYGLAEHNEMLEQSLMERNNLVQLWEAILDGVDMPSQLRSMEPEDKIQWLGDALSEAQNQSNSLQQKIDNLESICESITADVEDSQRRTSELEAAFSQACAEKEILSKDLEMLRQDNDESLKRIADFMLKNENLQYEASILQAKNLKLEEDKDHIEHAIGRLKDMVKDSLQDTPEDAVHGLEGVECLEEMLRKLIEKHKTLLSENSTDVHVTGNGELSISRDFEEQDVTTLSKKLDDSMGELACLKEEKDRFMLTNQSLLREFEELESKKKELEELLTREEHKSASLREKLNVAVRKGKSLVQQRDSMKQVIEELNVEVERLKSESKHTEKTIYEYEEQIKHLFAAHDRVQVVESENSSLRDRLAETEHYLQEREGSWSSILNALGELDVGVGINSGNPVERIKEMGKYLHDLHGRMDSLEQESRKSRRAAELLLAELNEVQERNDGLQDELAKVGHELSEVSREKDLAETAKLEALAHVEKLSYLHSEEKERQMSEVMVLKSGVDNMRNDLSSIERELVDVLSKDLEVLYNVKVIIKSCLDLDGSPALGALFPGSFRGCVLSENSENKVFMTQVNSIRERLREHSQLLQEETFGLSEEVMNVFREYTTQKEFYESLKRDVERLQSIDEEKELKLRTLQGNILLLFESCASAISRLERSKEDVVGNALASKSPQRNLNSQDQIEGNISTGDARIFNEESIRSMCDKLLLVVGDSISMHASELARLMDVGQSEVKSTIMNLQNELQEKDIQREKICKELVNQIREAETNANNHLLDLQQARGQLHDSHRQLDLMAEEHKLLEQRMKELQDKETKAMELQQKVNSLTDALAAKVQECEALVQALEEQEAEMENLATKMSGLENELLQKNKDLENLEASRAKALKKLSVTVSKFDELHYLSENLLSEVEKLQSQLQEKDGEISFLRQEVTRCTNDALAVTQMSKKTSSDEIQDFLSWLDSSISRIQVNDVAFDYSKSHLVGEYKEVLQKKILDLISELESLRVTTQNRDLLLQEERIKVEELTQKEQELKNSLLEMDSQLVVLQGGGDSAKATKSTSEIVEVEPMTNKWTSAGTIATQVRSLRKPNNDQVAIAIDMNDSSQRLEDDEDDDDKAHGFKSLTTSKIVPRFTRPVSNMVDGLWMSCDRALMRQPALRLGLIIYWAVLHTMLATFVV